MREIVGIRGGGDLATGVAHRLHRSGFRVYIMEIENPMMVRKTVCFGTAVHIKSILVENVEARLVHKADLNAFEQLWSQGVIPVLVDPEALSIDVLKPKIIVDGTLNKKNLGTKRDMADITIGLGPGFTAGEDVDFVVETMRGHDLGRVITDGGALPNTGIPESVMGFTTERVVRAPEAGRYYADKGIGSHVDKGQRMGWILSTVGDEIEKYPVFAEITGMVRGSIADGTWVPKEMKIADVDPRDKEEYCYRISDKARSIGGGVLEAILYSLDKNSPH